MTRSLLALSVLAAAIASPAALPAQWLESTVTPPRPSRGATMAFHPELDGIVRYGGYESGAYLGDTWLFTDTWNEIHPTNSPSARQGMELVFDADRSVIVGFGGSYSTTVYAETWEFNGTTWQLVPTATLPGTQLPGFDGPGLIRHRMVYDNARKVVVLHGGGDWMSFANNHEVWEYDGVDWLSRGTGGPGNRRDHGMAYWPSRGATYVIGGMGPGPLSSDLWAWDGTSWTQVPVAGPSPIGRFQTRLVHDPERDVLVLHSGLDINAESPNDTWEFDGTSWTDVTMPAPFAPTGLRAEFGMLFSPRHGRIVMHAGYTDFTAARDDTWLLGAGMDPFGSGCGVESLTEAAAPVPGSTAEFALDFLQPDVQAVAITLGLSDATSSLGSLPLGLAGYGAPGCTLLASPDATLAATIAGSVAQAALAIPPAPGLLGTTFFAQGLLLTPGTNVLGARTTNALRVFVGN